MPFQGNIANIFNQMHFKVANTFERAICLALLLISYVTQKYWQSQTYKSAKFPDRELLSVILHNSWIHEPKGGEYMYWMVYFE